MYPLFAGTQTHNNFTFHNQFSQSPDLVYKKILSKFSFKKNSKQFNKFSSNLPVNIPQIVAYKILFILNRQVSMYISSSSLSQSPHCGSSSSSFY